MNSPKKPDDPKTNFSGDWCQMEEAARKAHGPNWRMHLTPEELRAIDEGFDAECKWVSYADAHDIPGPRRVGVIDD